MLSVHATTAGPDGCPATASTVELVSVMVAKVVGLDQVAAAADPAGIMTVAMTPITSTMAAMTRLARRRGNPGDSWKVASVPGGIRHGISGARFGYGHVCDQLPFPAALLRQSPLVTA